MVLTSSLTSSLRVHWPDFADVSKHATHHSTGKSAEYRSLAVTVRLLLLDSSHALVERVLLFPVFPLHVENLIDLSLQPAEVSWVDHDVLRLNHMEPSVTAVAVPNRKPMIVFAHAATCPLIASVDPKPSTMS